MTAILVSRIYSIAKHYNCTTKEEGNEIQLYYPIKSNGEGILARIRQEVMRHGGDADLYLAPDISIIIVRLWQEGRPVEIADVIH